MLNLSAGVVTAGSAAQASDMTGDLKTGYLLRAKPRNQFIAQIWGFRRSFCVCKPLCSIREGFTLHHVRPNRLQAPALTA
jgi:uncharacterized oligopeptide transporter (OPT) family protein